MSTLRPTFPAEAENIDHVFTDLAVENTDVIQEDDQENNAR